MEFTGGKTHCKLVPLHPLGHRQLDLCMRFSCEYSGNCIRFSIFAQQNIDSVLKISYFGKTAERRRRKARWV